jgi:arabinogalactan oligomer / maltooligosaccharide transport system substrate-binding protein
VTSKLYKQVAALVATMMLMALLAACGDNTSTSAPATTAPAPAATTAAATTAAATTAASTTAAATTAATTTAATTAAATTAAATTAAATTAAATTAAATTAAATTAAPTTAAATTAAVATTPPAASTEGTLVIWLDTARRKALDPLIKDFSAKNNIKVTLQELEFGAIRDQLKLAGPAGQGPDIIIGANDWLGELVSNGLIDPLDVGAKASAFDPVATKAFTYNGKLYGLPYSTEAIALAYNKDLVPTPPKTWEELKTMAKKLQDDKKVDQGFTLQQGDPYHAYPVFSGFGGYVFGKNADGSYNPKDLGLDSAGAKAAAQELDSMVKAGLLKKDVTGDIAKDNFIKGKTAMIFTGPWNIKDFQAAKLNWGVVNIPTMKETPRPFVGSQGFMVSAFGKNKLLAKTFLTDFIATDDTMKAIYEADPRFPAWTAIQGSIDPFVKAFGESAKTGDPLPAIPEMSGVWDSWTKAINLIFQQQIAPDQAMSDAATAIRAKIK